MAALVWMSTQPFLASPSSQALARASLEAYRSLVEDDLTVTALRNSAVFGGAAALIATALAAVVAWSALRTQVRSRADLLDALAFLPIVVPGIVLGVGFLQLFLRSPVALYGTALALILGLTTRYLPYGTRFTGAGLARVGREMEEAARVGGAGWWQTFRRVTLPLMAAALGAAWLAVFTVAFTDVSLALVLASPGNEVVGVRIWSLYESGRWDELSALGMPRPCTVVVLAARRCSSAGATRVDERARCSRLTGSRRRTAQGAGVWSPRFRPEASTPRGRRVLHPARSLGLRQVDDAPPRLQGSSASTGGRSPSAAAPVSDPSRTLCMSLFHRRGARHGLPVGRRLAAHDRLRQRRVPARRGRPARNGRRVPTWSGESTKPSSSYSSVASARARPRTCPAASSSVSRSRELSYADRCLLLLDEPLSGLDQQLRQEVRRRASLDSARAGPDRALRHPRPGRGVGGV